MRFDGQVAVITGAAGGLGSAYAKLLASRGAKVLVNDLGVGLDGSPSGGGRGPGQVADEIVAAGGEALADTHDSIDSQDEIVRAALDAWGRVDVVITNAGFSSGSTIVDATPEDWRRTLESQVLGSAGLLRHAWPALRESGGRIVLVSSANALGRAVGTPYAAGKAGVIGLMRSVAIEGREVGVRANAIMPLAYTRGTEAIAARYGDLKFTDIVREHLAPERVANFVAFLAHQDSEVSGELFSIGGGRAARVFFGVSRGWSAPDGAPEDYRDHLEEILDTEGAIRPASGSDEMAWMFDNLGISYSRGPFLQI